MKKTSLLIVLTATFFIVSCGLTPINNENVSGQEYITFERHDVNYIILNESYVRVDDLSEKFLKDLFKHYKTNKILLGAETEFTMGDILKIPPLIKSAGGRSYYRGNDNQIREIIVND